MSSTRITLPLLGFMEEAIKVELGLLLLVAEDMEWEELLSPTILAVTLGIQRLVTPPLK